MTRAFSPGVPPLAALAAQALGWTPEAFWHATPAELAAALGPTTPAAAPVVDRAEIDSLMEQYPDA
ncbi:phage tail assembly chaperone [Citromicrobium bathyomarinum]|uniref:phage tail assembly chaperone n=1 Tax=Citromicrobium bathyomarinum TaxID=72174 RepID=UPI001E46569F|nr:phage tail assembly chaperone [Citromicrobium bathyomarinum]MCD1622642.1 phage tail assembly chaperone [Citromicrobium bathyomarinum]